MVHFWLLYIMEANTMDPDQTAPWEQSDLGPYYLQECSSDKSYDWWENS